MAKKTTNKKVLRAMSIGLAAMMAIQPVLATPVLAEDTEGANTPEPVEESAAEETTNEESLSEAQNDSTEAVNSVNAAEDSVGSFVEAESTAHTDAVSEALSSIEESAKAEDASETDTSLNEASTAVARDIVFVNGGTIIIENVETPSVEATSEETEEIEIDAEEEATEDIEEVEKTADKNVVDTVADAKKLVDGVVSDLKEGDEETEDGAIVAAAKDLDSKLNAFDEAKEDENLNLLYGTDASDSVDAAETKLNEQTEAFNTAKVAGDIDAANEAVSVAEEALEEAGKAVEAAKTDYDTVSADYKKALDELTAAKEAYDAEIAAGVEDLSKAEALLVNAQSKVDALSDDVNSAKEAYTSALNAIISEACKFASEEDGGEAQIDAANRVLQKYANVFNDDGKDLNWKGNGLFGLIMKEFYFPQVGIDPATVTFVRQDIHPDAEYCPDKPSYSFWSSTRKSEENPGGYEYTREQVKQGNASLYNFVIQIEGESEPRHYNFMLDKETQSIQIFESTEAEAYTRTKDGETSTHYAVKLGDSITHYTAAEDLVRMLNAGTVRKVTEDGVDTYYYKTSDEAAVVGSSMQNEQVSDMQAWNEYDVTPGETTYSYNAATGKIVETYNETYTTTTFTPGVLLTEGVDSYDYASVAAAEAAAKNLLEGGVADEYEKNSVSTTISKKETVDSTIYYTPTFTAKIDLSGFNKQTGNNPEDDDALNDTKDQIKENVKNALSGTGYDLNSITYEIAEFKKTNDEEYDFWSNWFPKDTYTITSGYAYVTFTKGKSEVKLDDSTLGNIGNWFLNIFSAGKSDKQIADEAKNNLIAAGAFTEDTLVSLDAKQFDWNWDKETITYTSVYKATGTGWATTAYGDTSDSTLDSRAKEDADEKAETKAKEDSKSIGEGLAQIIQDSISSGKTARITNTVINKNPYEKSTQATQYGNVANSYAFQGTYTDKSCDDTVRNNSYTKSYDGVKMLDEVKRTLYLNDKYFSGEFVLNDKGASELDQKFRDWLGLAGKYNELSTLKDYYEAILEEAQDASTDLSTALNKVRTLKEDLEKLKAQAIVNQVAIDDANAAYEAELAKYNEALAKYDTLSDNLNILQAAQNAMNEQAEAERIAAERAEAERIAAEQAEAERVAAEQAEAERVAAERAEAERIAAEQAEAERVAAERAEAERLEAERAEADRLAALEAQQETQNGTTPAPVVVESTSSTASSSSDSEASSDTESTAPAVATATTSTASAPIAFPVPTGVATTPATGIAAAPTAGVAGARTSANTAGTTAATGTDSAKVEAGTDELVVEDEATKNPVAITDEVIKTIKDEQVPLASFDDIEQNTKMNWWWLLLIAALGATGEEMYRRNKKKKEEKALASSIDKESK